MPLNHLPSRFHHLSHTSLNFRGVGRTPRLSRALAAMRNADQYGLDQMPSIDASVASLIVSPDKALRPDARCPRPQCRITDDLLTKSYDIAACMGHIGISFSHLVLALSQTLQTTGADAQTQGLSDASFQVFAFMTRELGRLMSILTLARCQVWLAQSPLSEACRKTLRTLPVVPGQMFGPAAQQALECSVQPMLRVSQGPATPHFSRAISIGPLSSLPFGRLKTGHLDTDHLQSDTPSCPKVGGVGPDCLDPGASRFSPQHLGQWEALTSDPWVLLTLSKGYSVQFRRRPPKFSGVRMTVVKDPVRCLALEQEISVLLVKGAIECVGQWFGPRPQEAPRQNDGGLKQVPPVSQTLEKQGLSLCSLGFSSFPSGGSGDRRLPGVLSRDSST
ncbi:hypothetical protein D5F01_LYC11070 [Larimichthys crocea]|uniref:Uncharacterized protein n=1 Tax=Larimichthys crocea TaxID=215358 RepID=A0A6G0IJM7_LARCR|nr:hypothetical protein D5F01_LYC11070 [Larimichthys crocea]